MVILSLTNRGLYLVLVLTHWWEAGAIYLFKRFPTGGLCCVRLFSHSVLRCIFKLTHRGCIMCLYSSTGGGYLVFVIADMVLCLVSALACVCICVWGGITMFPSSPIGGMTYIYYPVHYVSKLTHRGFTVYLYSSTEGGGILWLLCLIGLDKIG